MSLEHGIAILTLVAGAGSALVAGVFFAFSTFVMAGLARVGPQQGMRAMQGINEAAVTVPFMTLLFGTAAVSTLLGAITLFTGPVIAGQSWILAGLCIYFLGIVVVTITGNVPMNNALASLSAAQPSGHTYWQTYLSRWTLLNHIRTVASAVAATAFFAAYVSL